jgi:hypothetical protein
MPTRQRSQSPGRGGPAPGTRKEKGLIRSLNRASARPKKARSAELHLGRVREPSACERCGAIFARRTWRRHGRVTATALEGVRWTVCPACEQASHAAGAGRILVRGAYAREHEADVRRRIGNVAARAAFTQPERRVSSLERQGDELEVITTSQKLAHRIAHELRKAFGGRVSYAWSDDGTLFATWQR